MTCSVGSVRRTEGKRELLTQEQLGGPNYLNSELHAKLIFEWGKANLQDHPHPVLADADVKVIEWDTTWKSATDFFEDMTKVRATGALDPEDFEKIQSAMASSTHDDTTPKVKTKSAPRDLTPEERELKERKAQKQKALVVQNIPT